MQWKQVATMQNTSTQSTITGNAINNTGTQMQHKVHTRERVRERKKTLRGKQEMKHTLWCSETETEGKTKLVIGR